MFSSIYNQKALPITSVNDFKAVSFKISFKISFVSFLSSILLFFLKKSDNCLSFTQLYSCLNISHNQARNRVSIS